MSDVSRTGPRLSRGDIESIDRALNDLRLAINIPRRDPRRQEAAAGLARIGFSASQIVSLSGKRWPRQSVERWVDSVSTMASAPAGRAIEILAEAVAKNITFVNIETGLALSLLFHGQGVSPDDVLGFLEELRKHGIALPDFIEHYKSMKASGLTFPDFKRHLEYKSSLEKNGFGLGSLRLIANAARKYNQNPDDMLTAIDGYETIQKINEELSSLRQSKSSEETHLTELDTAVTKLESEQKQLQATINENVNTVQQLTKVTGLGYDLESLRDLERRTKTLGGVSSLLTALAQYSDLDALRKHVSDTSRALGELEAQRTAKQADNLHLQAHIEATRKLIDDHKLGLEAIHDLLEIAKKYGAQKKCSKASEATALCRSSKLPLTVNQRN